MRVRHKVIAINLIFHEFIDLFGNEPLFAAALAAGDGVVSQRWSRDRWLKMGGSGSAQLEARLVNSDCEIIPDLRLSRSVAVN